MSFTSVMESRPLTGSVFLTPSKRRRLTLPSTAEIYKWVFTTDAVASCFICDIRVMKRYKEQEEEFWWLKRVPCRTVKIVGMVVGIQVYEKKISYIVDDGTSVIECLHKCGPPKPQSPTKGGKNDLELPAPVAQIGDTVDIIGRIQEFNNKETERRENKEPRRQLQVQEIVRCKSVNDKLHHWKAVLDLHQNNYSLSTPFVIPASTSCQPFSELLTPSSTTTLSPSIASSTPSTSASSSPVKQDQSPRKLRHPSRLHTVDLTGNTFRIYIKHYMDNPPIAEDSDTESDLSDDEDDNNSVGGPSTPTKRSLHHEQTPRRPNPSTTEETPRPTRRPLPSMLSTQLKPSSRRGFTLSYLRRVPELSELALRVVKAEAKRRDREARKKTKEAAASQSRSSRSQGHKSQKSTLALSSSSSSFSSTLTQDSISSRIKRLWNWALVQLIQEGSIILWDGPTHPIISNPLIYSMNAKLWKPKSSSISVNTTLDTEVSIFSSSSTNTEDDTELELSDPDPEEEAYVALTAELLASEVERLFQTWLLTRSAESIKFTKDGILKFLRRDDRWMRVGDWHVEEAIDLLADRGQVRWVSKGVWGISPE